MSSEEIEIVDAQLEQIETPPEGDNLEPVSKDSAKGDSDSRGIPTREGGPPHEEKGATVSTSSEGGESDLLADFPVPVGDVTCWKHASSVKEFGRLSLGWLKLNKPQILSGITVALAQIPEAVSFSFVAGVDPIVGLQSAWIMGICTSLGGGRPGMVAGATGAVAVVLTNLVETKGIGHMFYAIMLAGILQMAFGFLRLGVLFRLIPHPVMVGFCNGLGIIIGTAQFNIFKVPAEDGDEAHRELSSMHIGGAFSPFTNGRDWVDLTLGLWMTFHIVITLLTYIFFPKITKAIPGSLAGIIVSTIVEWAFVRQIGYETTTVEDLASVAGSFPLPVWADRVYGYPDMLPPFSGSLIGEILPTAITAAAIGLLESLLTLQLIDELTNTKGNPNREAFGQGLGQFLSGMLGGMGGCTTIGQSLMNIHSGGFTRLSSTVAALFMLLIILVAYPLINLIPVASLAGVMFVVTYFTIEWSSGWVVAATLLPKCIRDRYGYHTKIKRSDVLVMLTVVGVTLLLDLAIAVGVGIVISCLVFAWDSGTRLHVDRTLSQDGSEVVYTVTGPIFFGSVKPLMEMFPDPRKDPKEAYVVLEHAEIYDWSGMVAIKAIHERFERAGTMAHFQKLSVTSHKLMHKSKQLWEDIHVFAADEEELEEEFHDPLVTPPQAHNMYNVSDSKPSCF